ncbi:unnamed protein product [Calypogeia fissa]
MRALAAWKRAAPPSTMALKPDEDTQTSLEKIKKRLSSASSSCLMEGSLLKRSETLRKWNQRWFTLDPTTGKMEYRVQQGDASARGLIFFEPESTITLSPINFHGAKKYDGCCFYVGTPQKKEYFLCAETPTIARAWVSTLRAASLVLKAHREAVDSLSGNGHAKLGTVAAVVAAANATAREGMKEIQQSLKASLKPLPPTPSQGIDVPVDDVSTVMKETLRVKDEELNQVARDLRARDYMIKEMADRLSETAEAAEAAASAAHLMEKERKQAQGELEDLKKEFDDRLYHAACEVRAGDERLGAALKAREIALQEAQRWRVELGKGREQIVMMEAAVVRAEESVRRAAADAEEKIKAAKASELAALAAKEEAINQGKHWQAQAQYYQGEAARYLGLLQQNGGVRENSREHPEEVERVQNVDESSIKGPAPKELISAMPPEKILPEVGAPQPDEQTKSTSPEMQTPSPVTNPGDEPSVFSAREIPAPADLVEGLRSGSDRNANYITAVDFEQLQVETYQVQNHPVISETTTEMLGVDVPVRPDSQLGNSQPGDTANSPAHIADESISPPKTEE